MHSHVVAEFTEGEGNAKRKLKQKKCYLSGIGTALPPDSWFYTRWRVKLGNLIDLAIAWYVGPPMMPAALAHKFRRFEHIVKEACSSFCGCVSNIDVLVDAWLMNHYKPGDRIFLFGMLFHWDAVLQADVSGFSRGAYQIRTIAGMIHTVRAPRLYIYDTDAVTARSPSCGESFYGFFVSFTIPHLS